MSERRYKPTKKRLREAHRTGKTPKSQLLTGAIAALALALASFISARSYWVENQILLEYYWLNGSEHPLALLCSALQCVWKVLVPCVVGAGVVAVGAQVLQVGFVWEFSALVPCLARVSPAKGLLRLGDALRRLGWAALLTAFLVFAAFHLVEKHLTTLQHDPFSRIALSAVPGVIGALLFVLAAAGALDLLAAARRYRDSVYMTLDEVRREQREQEGDPQLKAYRRAQHAALSRAELVARVRRAKVVIVERESGSAEVGDRTSC